MLDRLSILRHVDKASPVLFNMACSGATFETVVLFQARNVGTTGGPSLSDAIFLRFDFKLALVRSIAWNADSTSPPESLTLQYGGLQVRYAPASSGGSGAVVVAGWNAVKNVADTTTGALPTT